MAGENGVEDLNATKVPCIKVSMPIEVANRHEKRQPDVLRLVLMSFEPRNKQVRGEVRTIRVVRPCNAQLGAEPSLVIISFAPPLGRTSCGLADHPTVAESEAAFKASVRTVAPLADTLSPSIVQTNVH